MKTLIEGAVLGAAVVLAYQGVSRTNLTTTLLYFVGLAETHAKAVVKKTIATFKIDVTKL